MMRIVRNPQADECLAEPHAVAIGVFDGVHLGHQAVIQATRHRADELQARSAVVTFDPHPARITRPQIAPRILTGIEHRLELLASFGVDTTVIINFDEAQAKEQAADFVERVIVRCLQAKSVTVGDDFHFGYRREGNTKVLAQLGLHFGFDVEAMGQVERSDAAHEPISSTAIRRAVAAGDVVTAAALLGRHHVVDGVVVKGDQRGRTIGFPTANLDVPADRAVPADGVYAAWYVLPDGSRHKAAVNVGKRPTFYADADRSLVEAHLIDFRGDLYGHKGRVEFVKMIRSEQRFDGIDVLKAQLATDIQVATDILS
ncbi:MAG: bifunctional riboflavin kinase/FAD synthetase [Acidimicrobiales bacterium]|nr:bifunctional riboflavin kinase/FAD synthetase [Acidimicrobiales bacterium]